MFMWTLTNDFTNELTPLTMTEPSRRIYSAVDRETSTFRETLFIVYLENLLRQSGQIASGERREQCLQTIRSNDSQMLRVERANIGRHVGVATPRLAPLSLGVASDAHNARCSLTAKAFKRDLNRFKQKY